VEDAECKLLQLPKKKILPLQAQNAHNILLNKLFNAHKKKTSAITGTGNSSVWNSLPNKVVLADSVNCFKSRLDKFWQNQDIVYNFRAEIEGTGSRSEV